MESVKIDSSLEFLWISSSKRYCRKVQCLMSKSCVVSRTIENNVQETEQVRRRINSHHHFRDIVVYRRLFARPGNLNYIDFSIIRYLWVSKCHRVDRRKPCCDYPLLRHYCTHFLISRLAPIQPHSEFTVFINSVLLSLYIIQILFILIYRTFTENYFIF